MFINRKLKALLLSLLFGGVSLVQFTSSVKAIKPDSNNNDRAPKAGVTCYLVGKEEIKPPTISQLITSKTYLEKKYSKGRISKEVYESRLNAIEKQVELLINSITSRSKNLKETEQSIKDLKLLYENNFVDKDFYDSTYQVLNKKVTAFKTARIEESFASKFKSLDIRYEQKLLDKQAYNLHKLILFQEERYCLNHLLYSFDHYNLKQLDSKRAAGQLTQIQYLNEKLKLLKSLNKADERKSKNKE